MATIQKINTVPIKRYKSILKGVQLHMRALSKLNPENQFVQQNEILLRMQAIKDDFNEMKKCVTEIKRNQKI